MKSFVILGCGKLGKIVADAYKAGLLEGYELIGTYSRKLADAKTIAEGTQAKACESVEELLALKPDYLVETASIALLKEVALEALEQGTSVVPLSIGAFADEAFKKQAMERATQSGAKIHIPSGCVGGFDVLQTMKLMDSENMSVAFHTHKGPKSLQNTPIFEVHLLKDETETTVLSGTTAEVIQVLPTKVNVAVATALASIGPKKATAQITSVPGFVGDDHCITAEIPGIKAVLDMYSATADMAGWRVVALLRNLASPIQFF